MKTWLRHKFLLLGFFWYSKKQDELSRRMESSRTTYARQLFTGKIVRYSEWKSSLRKSNWDDARLVAIGFVYFGEQS